MALLRQISGLLLLLVGFCPAAPGAVATAPESGAKPQVRVVRVALDDNYPPFVMRQPDGRVAGFLVDEWKLWERATGVHVELQASDWNAALSAIRTGKADVIDTIFETPQRLSIFDFTPAYAPIAVNIYTDSRLSGVADVASLRGFQVAVKAGDACADVLRSDGIGDIVLFPDYSDIVSAALRGRVHVFCMDEPPATYLIDRANASARFRVGFTLYRNAFHRAVRKGDQATLRLVEQGFAEIPAKDLARLHEKWMGRSLENESLRKLRYSLIVASGLALFLALIAMVLRFAVIRRTSELASTRDQLQATLDALPDLMFELDSEGRVHDIHTARHDLLVVPRTDLLGARIDEFFPQEVAQSLRDALERAGELGSSSGEYQLDGSDGPQWFEFTVSRKSSSHLPRLHFIVLARDVSARKKAEERVHYLANYDALTGLPNRSQFAEHLGYAVSLAKREEHRIALLFVDLDHFKYINDSLGHVIGDRLLIELSSRLRALLREVDTLARLGGDEFIVMIPAVDERGAAEVATKLIDSIRQPVQIGLHELTVTASVGLSMYPEDGTDLDELLKKADSAMYRSKAAGRNSYAFFTGAMQRDADRHLKVLSAMRGAIDRGEFHVHYQPQLRISDRQLIGAEALLRWNCPQLGPIGPDEFISIAESSGLILPLGEWVLREVAQQLRVWLDDGYAATTIAINLSAAQFRHPALSALVATILRENDLDPSLIELELTESVMMQEPQRAVEIMREIHDIGVRMSIDDFGTGYSSLSQLKKLKVHKLKIDKSFIQDIVSDQDDRSIVVAIIELARSLSMRTVAEGVEVEEQLEFLRAQGCDEFQGYLHSPAVSAAEFASSFLPRIEPSSPAPAGSEKPVDTADRGA